MTTKEIAAPERVSDASVHLDAIRGLAALTVFLGHGQGLFLKSGLRQALAGQAKSVEAAVGEKAGTTASALAPAAPVPPPPASSNQETLGHEAVMVFFVLSGYFVGGSVLKATRKGYFSWKQYLFQRLSRLWVALLPALLLSWALDVGGMNLLPSQQDIYSSPPGQDFVPPGLEERLELKTFLGNLFFVQGIFTPSLGTNDSLWSLSYEFWYYIFFPLLVPLFVGGKSIWQRGLPALLAVGLMSMCGWQISSYFLIWAFGAGVSLLPLAIPVGMRKILSPVMLLVFLATLFIIRRSPFSLLISDLILGVVCSVFLWVLLHSVEQTTNWAYRTGAQALSNISYTLYLVHMPCFALLSAILMPVWQQWRLSPQTLVQMLGVYAVAFLVSLVMYFLFERNTDRIRARVARVLFPKSA